jgi:hypothetical protein
VQKAKIQQALQIACDIALAEYQRRKSGAYECNETTFQEDLDQFRVSVIAKGAHGFWVALDRNIYTMPKVEADIFIDPVQARVVNVVSLCSVAGDVHRPCSSQ